VEESEAAGGCGYVEEKGEFDQGGSKVVGEWMASGAHVTEDGEDGLGAVEEEEEVAEGGDVADLRLGNWRRGAGGCGRRRLCGAAGCSAECRIDHRKMDVVVEWQQCRNVPDVVFACFTGMHWICDRNVFALVYGIILPFLW